MVTLLILLAIVVAIALWAMGILVLWRVVSLEYLGRKEAQTLKGS